MSIEKGISFFIVDEFRLICFSKEHEIEMLNRQIINYKTSFNEYNLKIKGGS